MDMQTIINLSGGAFVGVLAWFANHIYAENNDLRREIHRVEINMMSRYVPKSEFADAIKRIEDMLGKIFDKLDGKVDK